MKEPALSISFFPLSLSSVFSLVQTATVSLYLSGDEKSTTATIEKGSAASVMQWHALELQRVS